MAIDPNKKEGCLIGCVLSIVIFIAVIVGIIALCGLLMRGCAADSRSAADKLGEMEPQDAKPADAVPEFKKAWSLGTGGKDAPQIIRIPLEGAITGSTQRRGWILDDDDTGASAALDRIHAATADKKVRGILLEINSPGGEVTASDVLSDAVNRFRASGTNRFVVVLMGDLACSGGYYVAAAADWIIARPTSWTGSIGVIIPAVNAAALAQKIGVTSVPVVSSGNKDLMDPLLPTNAEHVAILQRAVDQAYDRFLDVVAKGRKMPKDLLRPLADGRVYTAPDALANRLIDQIGYQEDALAKLAELAHAKDGVRVYRYESAPSLRKILSSSFMFQSAGDVAREVRTQLDAAASPKAEYRLR